MLPRSGFPGHNAVFEKSTGDNGFTKWKVFEYVEGLQGRKVLVGEIHINEYGYDSPLLFTASGDSVSRIWKRCERTDI